MYIEIDFESSEALYMQLHDQIIYALMAGEIEEGDQLPSVRSMAEQIGINMHTVNKAYAMLRDEGFLKLDQRRGAVIAVHEGTEENALELKADLKIMTAKALLYGISKKDIHDMIDEICSEWE